MKAKPVSQIIVIELADYLLELEQYATTRQPFVKPQDLMLIQRSARELVPVCEQIKEMLQGVFEIYGAAPESPVLTPASVTLGNIVQYLLNVADYVKRVGVPEDVAYLRSATKYIMKLTDIATTSINHTYNTLDIITVINN